MRSPTRRRGAPAFAIASASSCSITARWTERFDRIVSVGMFEHVGVHHYDEFFAKMNALLDDDGLMVLHSIGHMSPPGTASPWLRKYIFPGAYSPALSEVFPVVEQRQPVGHGSGILACALRQDAAHWHQRFEANRAQGRGDV